ncbi:acetyl-CoA carboxylase [Salinicola peritrichatus]|uniref:acetyl-CoA carboxylase n=1 Tax=Salinicola peritrichatus TaxID=1267424 RepID=UPI000DA18DD5|nr:acetyl-CoA carboxylase [Salinicola peritrichatus]
MPQQPIQAPFPGVFYRRPAPDQPPFVEPGQRVEADTVIGLIEVMKQFCELRAEATGTLITFEVEDETVVEAGQAIATLEGE